MAEARPRRRAGVRSRTTAAAVIVVGVALVLSSLLLLVLMRRSLERNVRLAADLRASDVAASLRDGAAPSTPRLEAEEDVLVQVVDPAGMVLASSPFPSSGRALLPPTDPGPRRLDVVVDGEADPFLVVTRKVALEGGTVTVLVGRDLDVVNESVGVVARILLAGVPILLLIVGLTTWWVVGRALAPVEAIRAEVSAISARELHRRVPVPSSRDEVARLARTMNQMLDRLEASHVRQLRLVSDASHELRSPIAAIRQHAEVALAHPSSTTVEALASDALAEDLRLQRIAEDLLLLARLDEHALRTTDAMVDLDDLVLAAARRLRDTAGARVETSAVGPARVRGDRPQLERVVRNLADNAARHATTTIRFALRAESSTVVLEVDDDGPGIAPEFRSAVFERFTRLDEARDRRVGGAGLGLSIVAELVEAHAGTVEVGEAPIGGARFSVVLPRAG